MVPSSLINLYHRHEVLCKFECHASRAVSYTSVPLYKVSLLPSFCYSYREWAEDLGCCLGMASVQAGDPELATVLFSLSLASSYEEEDGGSAFCINKQG